MLRTAAGTAARQCSKAGSTAVGRAIEGACVGSRRSFVTGRLPHNTIFHFIPERQAYVIERWGKRNRIAQSGFHIVLPFIERIAHVRGLMESTIPVKPQHAVTRDNVQVSLDGVVYYLVTDVYRSAYHIDHPERAIPNIAQSVMRKQVGRMNLDELFHNRDILNRAIEESLVSLEEQWGIRVTRYEVQDITMDANTSNAMQKESAAERTRRAEVLASEGHKRAEINRSEATRQKMINESEGEKAKCINESEGERIRTINMAQADAEKVKLEAAARAEALVRLADAQAEAIRRVAVAVAEPGGVDAVRAQLAYDYVHALPNVFAKSNTVVVPSDPLNPTRIVTQALALFNTENKQNDNKDKV